MTTLVQAPAIAPIDDAAVRRVGASLLAARVVAARSEKRMSLAALRVATGLSARTLRSIEEGDPDRRYSPPTLAALDKAFGWPNMTAWAIWRREPTDLDENDVRNITARLDALQRTVDEWADSPPPLVQINRIMRALAPDERAWVVEIAAAAASLSLIDRAKVLDMIRARHG